MSKKPIDPEVVKLLQQVQRLTGERNAALAATNALERALAKTADQRTAALGGRPLPWIPVPPPELGQAMRLRLEQAAAKGQLKRLENIAEATWNEFSGKPGGLLNVLIVVALLLEQAELEMIEQGPDPDEHVVEEAALGMVVFARHYVHAMAEAERGAA